MLTEFAHEKTRAGIVACGGLCPGLNDVIRIAALHAAHSADDRLLGAHILGCMADQAARYGQPTEAVTLIETAMVGVRVGSRRGYWLSCISEKAMRWPLCAIARLACQPSPRHVSRSISLGRIVIQAGCTG